MTFPRSIALQVSLAFALLIVLVFLALGVYLGRATDAHMTELDHHELHGKLLLMEHLANTQATAAALRARLDDALYGSHGVIIAIAGDQGFRYGDPQQPPVRLLLSTPPAPAMTLQTLPIAGEPFRAQETRVVTPWGETLRVIAGRPIAHHTDFLERLQRDFRVAVAAAALLTVFLGSLIARQGLWPLRQITQMAGGISAGALNRRIPTAHQPPELLGLIQAFNAMLDRLEQSFRQLSDYAADVAHELRTPLHTLRMQTEVTLAKPREPAEYRDLLASALEEYERLSRIISDMLFIAKADQGLIVPNRTTVDLDALLARITDYYSLLADPRQCQLRPSGIQVSGDALMLERAIGNLFVNAIQHTPPNGEIRVDATVDRDQACISIFNRGTPIPGDRLVDLFRRFQRLEAGHEGHGLGLAIALSIARAHGGTIDVTPLENGNRFDLRLPIAAPVSAR